MPRKHLTYEECLDRYPRLASVLQDHGILSRHEAGVCIRDLRDGLDYSCEAVSHSGRSPLKFTQDALNMAGWLKRLHPEHYHHIIRRRPNA